MKFDIITIFPHIFDSYFNESIIGRAQEKKLIEINVHNLRDYAGDKHKTAAPACATRKRFGRVDGKPFGGGPGMIFKVKPIYRAVQFIKSKAQSAKLKTKIQSLKLKERVILFSAKGKVMSQADIRRWAKYDQLILICGRYEGVDERVAEYIADEEISVGKYVLTGGEIPAMIVTDAVSRLIPGVINKESLAEESFGMANSKRTIADNKKSKSHQSLAISYLEYPQYTRPENFKGWKAPEILLSGNHEKIKEWREKNGKKPH